jgi:hypothetical protein
VLLRGRQGEGAVLLVCSFQSQPIYLYKTTKKITKKPKNKKINKK